MKLARNRKIRTVVLWLLFVVAGLGAFYQQNRRQDTRQQMENIRSRVWSEWAAAKTEQQAIKTACLTTRLPGPAQLSVPHQNPFCIFRNGSLVYWSDHRSVPDYDLLAAHGNSQLVNTKTGRFLVRRLAFEANGSHMEICSLIALQQRYAVENDYLQPGLNRRIFSHGNLQVSSEIQRSGTNIYSPEAVFLFAVVFPDNAMPVAQSAASFAFLLTICLLFLVLAVWLHAYLKRLARRRRYERGFGLLAVFLVGIRLLMLRLNIPNALVESELFSSKYYASSAFTPSLGDLLLDCGAALVLVVYALRHFSGSHLCRRILAWPPLRKAWLAGFLLLAGLGLLSLHFYFLRTLHLYSQVNLDITANLDFSSLRIACLVVFAFNSLLFLFANHLMLRLVVQFGLPLRVFALAMVSAMAVYAAVAYAAFELHPEILVGGVLYLFPVCYFRLPRGLVRFSYRATLYLFMTAVLCAGLGAWAVYEMERDDRLAQKRDFARQLLSENDPLGEFLLSEASGNIRSDAFIQSKFTGPFVSKNDIMKKARRYLGSYFDRYEVDVRVFDPSGLNLLGDDVPNSYMDYIQYFQQKTGDGKYVYGTAYDHVYFAPSMGGSVLKRYASLITILRQGAIIGFVVLDLQQKRIAPTNVYPELLLDKRFAVSPESRLYSYAIYDNGKLTYREGGFNYGNTFSGGRQEEPELGRKDMNQTDYQHTALKNKNNRTVVVSSPTYPLGTVFSNFSFLFLILVSVAGLCLLAHTIFYRRSFARSGFATRIQIYLNVAFFLPLIAVSTVTVSLLSATYRENLTQSYLETARNTATELRTQLDEYQRGAVDVETFKREINELARYTRSDVNVFGTDGKLVIASQRQIYDAGILSPYINRNAWNAIAEQNQASKQIAESVGSLHYNSVYVGIRDSDGKRLLGILSMPFFDSKADLEKQIISVLSTIMNIFTVIFIGFLGLSYVATRVLTVPLRLITQKLGKTSLQSENEPLEWDSNDEIGLMVGEYNRMLRNLEESKQALSRSEKESAWREMAQQVAHEIKNPLTPMKLTLQHLQRTLTNRNPEMQRRTEKSIGTLLDQVDTLSDIATSFSAFAKMPIPKNEQFDVAAVARQTAELYAADPGIRFQTHIAEGSYVVNGDAQLMGRIITNLIINGLQSVSEGREPCIGVSLAAQNGHVTIAVQDNGAGIADAIRPKVFLPHFSTKTSGSGIGLAVAKRGIEHAGGTIWFETEAGAGTTFFVQLPLLDTQPGFSKHNPSLSY